MKYGYLKVKKITIKTFAITYKNLCAKWFYSTGMTFTSTVTLCIDLNPIFGQGAALYLWADYIFFHRMSYTSFFTEWVGSISVKLWQEYMNVKVSYNYVKGKKFKEKPTPDNSIRNLWKGRWTKNRTEFRSKTLNTTIRLNFLLIEAFSSYPFHSFVRGKNVIPFNIE